MPIPSNQIMIAEIQMQGRATAGGSGPRNFNFIFHYRRSTFVNAPVKADLELAFQNLPASKILLALNARYTQTLTTVRWVNDALDAPTAIPEAGVGAIAGDGMPMHNSVFTLFRTGLRGRSFRGSKHFGPLSEADTTTPNADVLNAGAIALWATAITAMGTPLVDATPNTWIPCILSRKLSQLKTNPTVVVTNDIVAILLNKRVGRMRRREVASVY